MYTWCCLSPWIQGIWHRGCKKRGVEVLGIMQGSACLEWLDVCPAIWRGPGITVEQWYPTIRSALSSMFPCFCFRLTSCPARCSYTQNNRYGLETSGGTQRRLLAIPRCCECGQLLDVWGELALSSGAVVRTSLLSNLPLCNCSAASRKAPAENRFFEHASALQSLF